MSTPRLTALLLTALVVAACSSDDDVTSTEGPDDAVPEVIAHIDNGSPDEFVDDPSRDLNELTISTTSSVTGSTTTASAGSGAASSTTLASGTAPTTTENGPTTTSSAPGTSTSTTGPSTTSTTSSTTTVVPTTSTTSSTTTTAPPVPSRLDLPQSVAGIEGIAADPTTGRVFVGDMTTGDIWVGQLDGSPFTLFAGGSPVGRTGALGLAADAASGRLYVVSHIENRVDIHRLTNGSLLASVPMPGAGQLNDVTVAPNGTAYVTDMGLPKVFRIPAGTTTGELFVDYTSAGIVDTGRSLHGNGIIADDSVVLVASMLGGELLRFDRSSGAGSAVAQTGGITGRDGLVLCGNTLLGVDNSSFAGGSDRVLRSTLNGGRTASTAVQPITSLDFRVPSTAALLDGHLLVANAQFGVSTQRPFWVSVVEGVC